MNWKLKKKIYQNFGSQVDFAHEVRDSEALVSKVIRGRRKLQPDKQLIWADALDCKPEEIFMNDEI